MGHRIWRFAPPGQNGRNFWSGLIALALVAVAICAAGVTGATAQERYLLRSGDTIAVSVLEDPGMDQTALIRPDGRISLPIVGSVLAEGMTAEELQEMISKELVKSFVTAPTVTVALVQTEDEEFPSVYVIGQVNAPGRIEMQNPLTLLQALAMAGGPGPFAATGRISLRRAALDGSQVLMFDYDAVEQGGGQDLSLVEGDVIVVPERGIFE